MPIPRNVYETLLKRNEKYEGSWAIWADPEGTRATDGIGDLTVFDAPGIHERLDGRFVFVALNTSDQPGGQVGRSPWGNFHSNYAHSRDFMLRRALRHTEFWGSYITDSIKHIRENRGAEVVRYVRNHPDELARQREVFLEEMGVLGDRPTLVALGGNTQTVLVDLYQLPTDGWRVIRVPHYSGSTPNYRETVLAELRQ